VSLDLLCTVYLVSLDLLCTVYLVSLDLLCTVYLVSLDLLCTVLRSDRMEIVRLKFKICFPSDHNVMV